MDHHLKLESNLEHNTILYKAIDIWNQPSVKLEIKKLISTLNPTNIDSAFEYTKKIWFADLLNESQKKISFSKEFMINLSLTIRLLGNRLIIWLKNIFEKLEYDTVGYMYPSIYDYIDHTCWTQTGAIDEVKIFKLIHTKINGQKMLNIDYLFEEACNYCLKDYAGAIWSQYTEEQKIDLSLKIEKKINHTYESAFNMMNYWLYHFTKNLPMNFGLLSLYRIYDGINAYSNNLFMFEQAVKYGKDIAVKYFYQKLNLHANVDTVMTTIRWLFEFGLKNFDNLCLISESYYYKQIDQKFVNIFIYLWQNMTDMMRIELIKKHKLTILNLIFSQWISVDSFMKILQTSWSYFAADDYCKFLRNIMKILVDQFDDYETTDHMNLHTLKKIINTVCDFVNKTNIVKIIYYNQGLSKLTKVKQIYLLTCVIDHLYVNEIRGGIHNDLKDVYQQLVCNEKYQLVDKLFTSLFDNYNDKKLLKASLSNQIMDNYRYFLTKKNMQSAENFLLWQYKSITARTSFKNTFKDSNYFIFYILDVCINEQIDNGVLSTHLLTIFDRFKLTKNDIENLLTKLRWLPELKGKLSLVPQIKMNELIKVCNFKKTFDHTKNLKCFY